MCNYTSSYIKVDLCAHTDSKNGIFTRRVYSAYILTRTPSPFSAGSSWGLLSRKIFSNFIFLILARYLVNGFLRLNNFFYFFLNPLSTRSNYTSIFIFFWFSLVISEVWIEIIFSRSYFTRILNRIVYSSIFILSLDKFCS